MKRKLVCALFIPLIALLLTAMIAIPSASAQGYSRGISDTIDLVEEEISTYQRWKLSWITQHPM